MKNLLIMIVVAMAIGYPPIASADLIWVDAEWSVEANVYHEFPPYSTGSATFSDPAGDELTGYLSAYAENPPGTGGPQARAILEISRSFRVVDRMESVALIVPVSGVLSDIWVPTPGVGHILTIDFDVLGPESISIFRQYSFIGTISETLMDIGTFSPGEFYTIQGKIELHVWAFSGGPTASGDVSVGVRLSPTPQPVPEPGGSSLLATGVAGWIGVAWRRRRKLRRSGP